MNLWTGFLAWEDALSESTNPLDRLHDVENRLSWLTNPQYRLGGDSGCTVMINQPSGHTVLCGRINYHCYPNLWTKLMVWEDTMFWLTNPLDILGGVGGCTVMVHQRSGQTWWCEDALSWPTNPLDRLGGVGGCTTTINQQLPISPFSQCLSANTRAYLCNNTNS